MSEEPKKYHHWVAWSEEDQFFVGHCPDLSNGGMCHNDDPRQAYNELIDLMEWHCQRARENHKPLPQARLRPVLA